MVDTGSRLIVFDIDKEKLFEVLISKGEYFNSAYITNSGDLKVMMHYFDKEGSWVINYNKDFEELNRVFISAEGSNTFYEDGEKILFNKSSYLTKNGEIFES